MGRIEFGDSHYSIENDLSPEDNDEGSSSRLIEEDIEEKEENDQEIDDDELTHSKPFLP
jgi:hypothetical protein